MDLLNIFFNKLLVVQVLCPMYRSEQVLMKLMVWMVPVAETWESLSLSVSGAVEPDPCGSITNHPTSASPVPSLKSAPPSRLFFKKKLHLILDSMNSSSLAPLTVSLLTISRCDRWQAYQRLQALQIPCHCTDDGRLEVSIHSPLAVLQLRSVVQQLTASRSELLHWLGRCWQAD